MQTYPTVILNAPRIVHLPSTFDQKNISFID